MEQTDPERQKLLQVLDKLTFFENFSDYEKKRITAFNTHVQQVKMGSYLVKEGHTDTSFFIILTGSASVVKAGKSSALAELRAGDFFGEISFLTNRPRTSNVVASESMYVLRVDQELMARLGAEIREKIKDRIIERLVDRLDDMNDLVGKVYSRGRF
jgi:CRP-like cAMP-binding protein